MPDRKILTDDQVRERLAKLDAFIKEGSHFQTWDMVVPFVDGNNQFKGLEGVFTDWPKQVQDAIGTQMILQCVPRKGHIIKIVASGCYQEAITEPCYLRVVVQEFPEQVN